MKRILSIVAILLIATPALATVTITASEDADAVVRVSYNCDDGEQVRSFALEITVDQSVTIDAISDFNVGDNNGYGVFPGKFRDLINATSPNWADPCYNPIAPDVDPGASATGLGTNKVIVEMGSLYEDTAPLSSGTLFVLDCNCNGGASGTLAIAKEDVFRVGVVDVNGEVVAGVTLTGCTVTCGVPECYPSGLGSYQDWLDFGKPDCWCGANAVNPECAYQCYGDSGCDGEIIDWRVYNSDLALLLDNWKKKGTDPTLDPCADTGHDGEIIDWRVYNSDLAILLNNWKKKGTELATFPPCPTQ